MKRKLKDTTMLWVLLVLLIAIVPSVDSQAIEGWKWIQNGSQGYVLQSPQSATVQRYDPEGILHITLASDSESIMMVRMHANLSDPTSEEKMTDSLAHSLVAAVLENVVSSARYDELKLVSIAGTTGVSVEMRVACKQYRMLIWGARDRAYSITYSLGNSQSEELFAQIVATVRPMESCVDQGFEVIRSFRSTIAEISVPEYYQNDSRWVCDQIGNCTAYGSCSGYKWACPSMPSILTIGDVGCLVSSYAMVFEYYTPAHFMTPLELDTCYTAHGEYGDFAGCGLCGRYWTNLNQSNCKPPDVTYFGDHPTQAEVDADLLAGYPLVGEIPPPNGHYVVLVGKSGTDYLVNNPVQDGRTVYAFGEFSNFVRFRGPVGTCCGCLPLNCCYGAMAQAGGSSSEFRWADSGISNPATSMPCPASGRSETIDATEPAALPEIEEAVNPTDEPVSWDTEPPMTATVSMTESIPVLSEDTTNSPAIASFPAQRAPVEPQRTPPTSTNYRIPKSVFGSGGGPKASTHYLLNSTQGQSTDLSRRTSTSYVLTPGYWSRWTPSAGFKVYLPLVTRNH